jgi:hypothetical protein
MSDVVCVSASWMPDAPQYRSPTESVTIARLPLHFDKSTRMLLSKNKGNACKCLHGSNCRKERLTC